MSGIEQMAAGVAHEINNPINFIHGNIEYANSYVRDLLELISLYQQQYPNPSVNIQEYIEEIDLDFLTKDLPKTLSSLQIGSDKIREIVVSMRNFSRLDECSIAAVDIKKGIDSTLIILNHRLKSGIKLIKEYGNVPPIRCYPAQLNQVFMNIISNAIDAIEETQNSASWNSEEIPTIWIITEVDGDYLKDRIKDNGPGIAPEIREKIFESFFTTKSVGKGTGLGLAISYQIVAKHNGTIEVNSEPGKGTEFAIALPVESV
jgi:signal transduction histidine kinase